MPYEKRMKITYPNGIVGAVLPFAGAKLLAKIINYLKFKIDIKIISHRLLIKELKIYRQIIAF